ncbi:restriction endonuclease subunit S [Brachyspira alvinipulli]|uniref:restriction endonuclease subunit S n=1 Tax=Brachyspira alvinipulli TaxID=84379 RepID=UPI0004898630|nr:restriction endonuclease subunit S [Brachyspira alvinipulli]
MSTLENLIKKHCPDGVEYVPLWSVTIWDKKFNSVDKEKQSNTIKYKYYLADELKQLIVPNGNVKILTTNCSDLFTLEELVNDTLTDGEVVCIPWGGNPIVQYYKGKFITSDNRIATSIDVNKLDNKFLYYVLINKLDLISSFYRGAGIKHPDMSRVLDIIIPIPPIEIQKEIVRILDEFTLKTAELQNLLHKEYISRKKQYEYYRDKILTFGDNVPKIQLKDLFYTKNGYTPSKSNPEFWCSDDVSWFRMEDIRENGRILKEAIQKVSFSAIKGNVFPKNSIIVSTSATIGEHALITCESLANQRFTYLILKDEYKNKFNIFFLFYYCFKLKEYCLNCLNQGNFASVDMTKFNKFEFPIIDLKEQEQIVKILDRFDALCNDISSGLPAEIEMRKKQYEYYRDKLLTFKEKKV